MKVLIGALEFDGPFHDVNLLADKAGIFAFICHNEDDDEYELLELGEADSVRVCVRDYDKRSDWRDDGLDVAVVVYYTEDATPAERHEIKLVLEQEFDEAAAAA